MDIREHNRTAWNHYVEQGNPWTIPVTPEDVAAARQGEWQLYLTESIPVPRDWFPATMTGVEVLCLASGGGQQGPILAATGASVTVFDNSPRQLARDAEVAKREGLAIRLVEGDMRDLSAFEDASFDLIFHPVSNLFVPEIEPVWREAFRVLRAGGWLLAGFVNPVDYAFDVALYDEGIFTVKHPLPYTDADLTAAEREELFGPNAAIEFSHSLDTQLGGQLAAGFMLTGFYESRRAEGEIAKYMPSYIATRALKPKQALS